MTEVQQSFPHKTGSALVHWDRNYVSGIQTLLDLYSLGLCPNQPIVTIDGKVIPRPLTFKENIEARVNDYNTLKCADGHLRTRPERLNLFGLNLHSCTGLAYQGGALKFKIKIQSKELITIPKDYNAHLLSIDYETFPADEEFDYAEDRFSDSKIAVNLWSFLVGNQLYAEYVKILEELKISKPPGLWLETALVDHLVPLTALNQYDRYKWIDDRSSIDCRGGSGSFLRIN